MGMKLIKRITQGNRTLEHHTYIDSFGIKRDSFELRETDERGFRTLIPFLPNVRVKTFSRDSNLLDATDTYTGEDYERMLSTKTDKQIIDKDCPEHGSSELAKEKFWKRPLTAHWGCKCEKRPTKTDNITNVKNRWGKTRRS